ncbi:hypothetical protein ACJBCE_36990 [Streptomyces sp. NBUL23]|uniref:hypothetical protein n=1 Tax=Streptomyces sp. NBUL23 TaxID=3381354 RepID=UPI003870F5E6
MTAHSWREATRTIKRAGIGALYEHRTDRTRVVVADLHEPTGYVWWQRESGPGWGDRHRFMKSEQFLSVYQQRER